MKITFDQVKNKSNLLKHGVSLADADRLDWNSVMVKPDTRRDYQELREIGYGLIDDRLYCIVLVQRGDTFHIISLRKANTREVKAYVEQTENLDADS
jgi:uncharacterized DUF497 family protein